MALGFESAVSSDPPEKISRLCVSTAELWVGALFVSFEEPEEMILASFKPLVDVEVSCEAYLKKVC